MWCHGSMPIASWSHLVLLLRRSAYCWISLRWRSDASPIHSFQVSKRRERKLTSQPETLKRGARKVNTRPAPWSFECWDWEYLPLSLRWFLSRLPLLKLFSWGWQDWYRIKIQYRKEGSHSLFQSLLEGMSALQQINLIPKLLRVSLPQ